MPFSTPLDLPAADSCFELMHSGDPRPALRELSLLLPLPFPADDSSPLAFLRRVILPFQDERQHDGADPKIPKFNERNGYWCSIN